MAANPRQGPGVPSGPRRLSVAEARFYAAVFSSARKGSLAELRRAGCEEAEAEEAFTAAIERVMERVDPIARGFSEAQMVTYIKRTCWTELLAERRRRGLREEIELGKLTPLADSSSPSPGEIAEDREAAAIGREALQMLPDRDRLIFRQRHQMGLSPQEILQNTPGLSPRAYRKVIQRANARVLDAYWRIRDGERCEEMHGGLLRRYVAEESPKSERRAIEAHLAHCRACRRTQSRMRGYLADVAGALLIATSKAEPSRDVRERIREALLRLAARLPGQGGEAAASQALSAPALKVATACAGVAAGACFVTGIGPGVGLLAHQGSVSKAPAQSASPHSAPARSHLVTLFDTLPSPGHTGSSAGNKRSHSTRKQGSESTKGATDPPSTSSARLAEAPSYSAAEAQASGRQVGTEMGAESGGTPLLPSTSEESRLGSDTSNQSTRQGNHVRSPSDSEFGL